MAKSLVVDDEAGVLRAFEAILSARGHEVTAVRGMKQSVTRTLNTMMSVLIMLFSLFFLGSESIRWFILALIFGMIIGTYSSYFIATALLILWK